MSAGRPRLDIDATRERLLALGCVHAAEQLGPLLAEAVREEVPAHTFLDRLLAAELSGREERRVQTSLRLSNLPTGQTLENFDFAFQPAIERSRIETLATCAWVRDAETVLLQGPPGVGKTHLCIGLGVKAVQLGFSVQYFRFDELMAALKGRGPAAGAAEAAEAHVNGAAADRRGRLRADDPARGQLVLPAGELPLRPRRGAITTNKSVQDWTELLAGDEVLATAILDRLLHRAHVLNIRGRSYRLRDLEDALKQSRA